MRDYKESEPLILCLGRKGVEFEGTRGELVYQERTRSFWVRRETRGNETVRYRLVCYKGQDEQFVVTAKGLIKKVE